MKKNNSFRVLIAPLDWGLGHTTRCIPVIRNLLLCQCDIIVACNPVAKQILQQEFSNLSYLPLQGYEIKYAASKWKFTFKILIQIPKILARIHDENRWLQSAVREHDIDLIISDNRYGLYHKKVHSVFITHQLQIQTPFLWLTRWVQKKNYDFINRFSECWVPDYEGNLNIAGRLSHPKLLPKPPLYFIGPLSRFSKDNHFLKKYYKWMILLSGPEPQRTILEKKMMEVIPKLREPVLLVRGLPASCKPLSVPANCTSFNHLAGYLLQDALNESEYVVTRSGYTSVMEILALQKKAILVPTPGQTEQEYLAIHLKNQHWCYACKQEDNVITQLLKAEQFDFKLPSFISFSLPVFLQHRIAKVKARNL